MKKLSQTERRAIREVLAAKTFDEALHRTPESILERLFELWGGTEEAHDFFDADMFSEGIPLSPKKEAKLVRAKKVAARRGQTVKKRVKSYDRAVGRGRLSPC